MKNRPELPSFISKDLPVPPLSWHPAERHEAAHAVVADVAFNRFQSEAAVKAAREYSRWLRHTYLMPGVLASVWRSSLLRMSLGGVDQDLFETRSGEEYDHMLETFESEHLGLPRLPSGTRWWPSNAGGGGSGSYPAEAVASAVNLPTEAFVDYVRQHKTGAGYILARSDVYLFAVTDTRDDTVVNLGHINRLSEAGSAFLENMLEVFVAGQKHPDLTGFGQQP